MGQVILEMRYTRRVYPDRLAASPTVDVTSLERRQGATVTSGIVHVIHDVEHDNTVWLRLRLHELDGNMEVQYGAYIDGTSADGTGS